MLVKEALAAFLTPHLPLERHLWYNFDFIIMSDFLVQLVASQKAFSGKNGNVCSLSLLACLTTDRLQLDPSSFFELNPFPNFEQSYVFENISCFVILRLYEMFHLILRFLQF